MRVICNEICERMNESRKRWLHDKDILLLHPPGPTAQNSDSAVLNRTLTLLLEPTKNPYVDQFPSIPSLCHWRLD
jgi:hypothetical protein